MAGSGRASISLRNAASSHTLCRSCSFDSRSSIMMGLFGAAAIDVMLLLSGMPSAAIQTREKCGSGSEPCLDSTPSTGSRQAGHACSLRSLCCSLVDIPAAALAILQMCCTACVATDPTCSMSASSATCRTCTSGRPQSATDCAPYIAARTARAAGSWSAESSTMVATRSSARPSASWLLAPACCCQRCI